MMGIREIRDDLTFATEAPTDNGDAEEKPLYNVLGDEESLYQTRQRTDTERYPHLDVLKKNSMKKTVQKTASGRQYIRTKPTNTREDANRESARVATILSPRN